MPLRPTLKDLGDIGNVVAAVGVIISLLVVAWEIHGNTKALHADVRLQMVQLNKQSLEWLRDPSFTELAARAEEGVSALSDTERRQYLAYMVGIFDQWEQGYLSYRDGLMEESVWTAWNEGMRAETANKGSRQIWALLKPYYNKEFQSHIERDDSTH